MSMGNYANYDDVVQDSTIEKFCKKEWDAFQKACADSGDDWEDIAMAFAYDDKVSPLVQKAMDNLTDAFEKNTGLSLSIGYRSEAEGADDGGYWIVGGVYEMTPAGKKMQKYIEREMWTTFG